MRTIAFLTFALLGAATAAGACELTLSTVVDHLQAEPDPYTAQAVEDPARVMALVAAIDAMPPESKHEGVTGVVLTFEKSNADRVGVLMRDKDCGFSLVILRRDAAETLLRSLETK